MPTRFDHVMIAVRDLDTAIKQFQRLGFDARPGGRHTGRGTHNGLIRFGLDYVELLSVYDEAEARANNSRGQTILDALNGREAAQRNAPLDSPEVEVTGQIDPRSGQPGYEHIPVYPHNIAYTVHLTSSASEEEVAALHQAVERACPILNLLINPQQISGSIVHINQAENKPAL